MPLDRHDSLRSRVDVGRLQRELEAWRRERAKLERQVEGMKQERKQLEKHLKDIERACGQALRPGPLRAQAKQNGEQLQRYLKQIDRACGKALVQLRRSL